MGVSLHVLYIYLYVKVYINLLHIYYFWELTLVPVEDSPIPVAERSKAWVCSCSPAGIAGSNTAGAWMFVCCECCVFLR
jgi:hypothetical protein